MGKKFESITYFCANIPATVIFHYSINTVLRSGTIGIEVTSCATRSTVDTKYANNKTN